jgi:hypothetical protein
MTEVYVLQCECGCKAYAVSINGYRITPSSSGGPWKILLETKVDREELLNAVEVTGYD